MQQPRYPDDMRARTLIFCLFHANHFGCNLPVKHMVKSLLLNTFFKKEIEKCF